MAGQNEVGEFLSCSLLDLFGWTATPNDGSAPAVAAGRARLYYNSSDNTIHVINSAGQELLGSGGGGTVSSVSFTGGIISVATPTTTPALTIAGTSGGIPFFSSTNAWASSALLAATGLVIGGGAGVAPATSPGITYVDGATQTLTIGLAGVGNGKLALAGTTSGTATLTAPAVAGTATNPITVSNLLFGPDGDVTHPTFGFTSATTTGMFRSASGILFTEAGTQIMSISSSSAGAGGVNIVSTKGLAFNGDTAISRLSAGVIQVGVSGGTPDATGSLSLSGITMAGVLTNSLAGSASVASVLVSGTPFTGGTGTTTFPLVYLSTAGATAPTTFSTSGTMLGFNSPSGFTGNFLDVHNNGGATLVTISSSGGVTSTNLFQAPVFRTNGTGASTGLIRMATAEQIVFRNNANSANIIGLSKSVADVVSLGDTAGGNAAGPFTAKRLSVTNATTLVAGDFTIGAGWGNTASIAITDATSKDQAAVVTITANGTGMTVNPTLLITFKDGTFTQTPVCIVTNTGGTGAIAFMTVSARSATSYTFVWNGTPSAGLTYEISFLAIGT